LRSILFTLGLALLLVVPAAAQSQGRDWSQARDPYVGGIGLNLGASAGSGLAFRWPALRQTMFTLSGAAWGKSGEVQWDLGLESHYVLRQAGATRLFVGPSAAFYQFDDHSDWNVGAGVGIEQLMWSRWALKVDLSFTWLSGESALYPLPQVGLLYYW
jgi:hypothetical protein